MRGIIGKQEGTECLEETLGHIEAGARWHVGDSGGGLDIADDDEGVLGLDDGVVVVDELSPGVVGPAPVCDLNGEEVNGGGGEGSSSAPWSRTGPAWPLCQGQ